MTRLTKLDVINICKSKGEFVVHRYTYRHEYLRKLTYKMLNEGTLRYKNVPDGYDTRRIYVYELQPEKVNDPH